MDSVDLLAREDEFKKLNRQLQKKTESLMKEIENVMQKPDAYPEVSTKLYSNRRKPNLNDAQNEYISLPESAKDNHIKINRRTHSNDYQLKNIKCKNEREEMVHKSENNVEWCSNTCPKLVKCVCCTSTVNTNDDIEFLYAFVDLNVKDKVLPQSFMKKAVTVETVCKCLASKIQLMQEQIDKLQNSITKKTSQCDNHLSQLAEMESERMSWLNKTNHMKGLTADMKAKCGTFQNKLEEKDRLYKELRGEADKHTAELKRLRSRNVGLEARCASQEETINTLRQQLETSRRTEKEMRDCSRAMSAAHDTTLSRSGAKQRTAEACSRAQAALIENLRRQISLLTTDGAMKCLHDEYTNLLSRDF